MKANLNYPITTILPSWLHSFQLTAKSQLHLTVCTSTYHSFINVVYFLSASYFNKHKVIFKQYTAYSLQFLIENMVHFLPFLRNRKHLENTVFESVHLPFHFIIFTRISKCIHHQYADDMPCFHLLAQL